MEDTCVKENCWFYVLIAELSGAKTQSLDFKNCPFYQEMIFTPQSIGEKTQTAKVIHDCSNKRSLLVLLEDILPRMMGVQKSNEEMRNANLKAEDILVNLIHTVNKKNIESTNIINMIEE